MEPIITAHGPLLNIHEDVVMPSAFTAEFRERGTRTTLEIETDKGIVRCASITISKDRGMITSRDLKVRLATELLPAAISAASSTVMFGPADVFDGEQAPTRELGAGTIGSISVRARLRSDLPKYDVVSRTVGRPKTKASPKDLRDIAKVYKASGGSLGTVRARFNVSNSTAHRRVEEAREQGLLPPQDPKRARKKG